MKFLAVLLIICLWSQVEGEGCPSLYRRYSQRHTYCLSPNSTCDVLRSRVTSADKHIILKWHNAYRSKVAREMETTYTLPGASDMLEMVWDDELAILAQNHADQCSFNHDCSECRRVKNFAVGQNLYTRKTSPSPPKSDWTRAISKWYNEVKYFQKDQIDSFREGHIPPVTGHFTQMIWAETWRVGCGYTMYKEQNRYVELYTCNYGPFGNAKNESVYKKGTFCKSCPENSCCTGKTCSGQFSGLCRISGEKAPKYNYPKESTLYCSFNNEPDCDVRVISGVNKWKMSRTLSGSYVGIILNGGESSTLRFTTAFKLSKKLGCLVNYFRSGPQVAGTIAAHDVKLEIVRPPSGSVTFTPKFQHNTLDFKKFSIVLNSKKKSLLSLKFSVPPEMPPQYLEFKGFQLRQGTC